MREFCRVLEPSGWAIPQVSIATGTTFEYPAVISLHEQENLFGQSLCRKKETMFNSFKSAER
jgi:hypothetical protein